MQKLLFTLTFLLSTLFCVAQFADIHSFNYTNGGDPSGSLILSADSTKVYGMTPNGGANNYGCIFVMDTNGSNYRELYDFNYIDGAKPFGSLVLAGGNLYGVTRSGGINQDGVIFQVDTVNGGRYRDIFNFNYTNGKSPNGSLIIYKNVLYGTTDSGGTNGQGNIFSIDTNGTHFRDMYNFNGTSGSYPMGSLTMVRNKLYGMTNTGGAHTDGVIFSIDTNGAAYKDMFDFTSGIGTLPYGSLVAGGNALFGMTYYNGLHNQGVLFSIDTNGSGYKILVNFSGPNGSDPEGSLIVSGNRLYGMTSEGGINASGNVFSVKTNGTGFVKMFDFDNINGGYPKGDLVLDGNSLLGMTMNGGANSSGVVFKIDTNAVSYLAVNSLMTNSEELRVYPNPNNGRFTIEVNSEKLKVNSVAEIYNSLGQKVYSSPFIPDSYRDHHSSFIIDVSGQPAGIYLYRVITEMGDLISSGKVVVEK